MKKIRRPIVFILAAVMVLMCLSGCGKAGEDTDTGSGNSNSSDNSGSGGTTYTYTSDFQEITGEFQSFSSSCVTGDSIVFAAYVVTGTQTETMDDGSDYTYNVTEMRLFSMNLDGTDVHELTAYTPTPLPEGVEGNAYMSAMTNGVDGTILALEDVYSYWFDTPEDFSGTEDEQWDYYSYDEDYYLRTLDSTGAEISSINLTELLAGGQSEDTSYIEGDVAYDDYFYVNTIASDTAGNIYICSDTNLIVLDPNGQKLMTLESENYIENSITLADGTVYFLSYGQMEETADGEDGSWGYMLQPADLETKDWGEKVFLPSYSNRLCRGTDDYQVCMVNGTSFCGVNLETGETASLFNFLNCDVNPSDIEFLEMGEDGSVLVLTTAWDSASQLSTAELVTIHQVDASTLPEKTTLTFASAYVDYNLRSTIIDFNRSSNEYRIEVLDYSEYDTSEDSDAGMTKLQTEMLAGKVPDMFSTNNMPVSRLAAAGYLEDLWPYIESDTEIGGRDGVVTSVFDALSSNGKLYQIMSSFEIKTVLGSSSILGDRMGWTFEELQETIDQLPDLQYIFDPSYTKDDVLSELSYSCMDDLVNWETGECRFDTQEFIDMLNFANLFPAEFDWETFQNEQSSSSSTVYIDSYEAIASGQQLLFTDWVYDFSSWRYDDRAIGGSTFIGFPGGSGNGSSFVFDSGAVAMSSTCADKEGAWQFMRLLLTEEYQEEHTYGLPTNKARFDAALKEATTPVYSTDPDTGEQVESTYTIWISDDNQIEMTEAVSQEDADRILALINSTTSMYTRDEEIYNIVSEQAGAFFAGDKTAEETARLIQSSVNIYVNEQR